MKIIIFILCSLPIIYFSRHSLFNIRRHGFYRFWSWEAILWLVANDARIWFSHPFSIHQIISWILLILSLIPAIIGIMQLVRRGKPKPSRDDEALFKFEKTTQLITTGIYKYIRHPLYSSLLILTWGVFFKNPIWDLLPIAIFSTACLIMTAHIEEQENINFFGEVYLEYKKNSKIFIPYIF